MFSSAWILLLSLEQIWFSGSLVSSNLTLSFFLVIFLWHLFIFFSLSLLFLPFFISVICLAVNFTFLPFDPLHNKQCRAKQDVGYTIKVPNSSPNYRQPTYDNVFYLNHRPVTYSQHVCTHIYEAAQSHAQIHVCDVAWRDLEYLSHHHIPFILVITR